MRVLNRIVLALLLFIPLSGVLFVCRQVAAETVTAGNEQRLLSDVRQVIFEGRRSGEGYFSSDGSRMIFQSEREPGNPFYQIYLMDLETGDIQRVSTGRGKTTCGWIHPRGDRVLFASTHEDPEAENKQQQELGKRAAGKGSRYSWSFDEHYDIYTADNNGRISENITRTMGYDAEGSWSPDGEMIAFASNRRAYEGELPAEEAKIFQHDKSYFMDIYIMGADGSGVRRLTSTPGYDGGPFFSPDGKSIVWRRFNREGDKAEIWTMNLDGTEQKRITHLDVMSWAPFFHPSGDYIIFTNNRHGYGNFELYIVDRNGRSAPVRVTDTPGFDGLPVFSPNGAHLSWTSSRTADHRPQIFQAKWNDTEARKLLGLDSMVAVRVRSDDMDGTAMPDIGRTVPEIRPEDLRLHVEYLASDKLEGRLTGSQGERLATDYVAAVFRSLGLLPAGEDGRYFQEFDFTSGVSMGEENRLMFRNGNAGETFVIDQDWRPLPFSRNGAVEPAPVVFAGYGVVAPASDRFPAYDAYGELEVKDKWVMMFRYLPEDITPEHRQYLVNYAELHYKAMLARDRGALGIILVSGPNAGVEEQLIRLSLDAALSGTSIAGVSITDRLAAGLFGAVGRSLPELQTKLDQGEALPGFPLPGVRIQANIDLILEQDRGRNVLARLTADKEGHRPAVVVGAHVDHLGRGEGTDSLADGDDVGLVHNGADDNASGVAAMLEIAQYLADRKANGRLPLERDVLFAAWSGEELGLLGSSHFVHLNGERKPSTTEKALPFAAYLNLDMVGRLDENLYLQGVGSSSVWMGEIERRNVPVGLSIVTQLDSYLPTDATSFYLQGVPVLSAFTGVHRDYNTPRDTADRLNYPDGARVARLMGLIARSLALTAKEPDYISMEKPGATASRRNLRAYLGTIPEYGDSDALGVRLNGVAKSGPADRAGLQRGDLIVEMAGRKIENIYDYTHALNGAKVGQPVPLVVQREGHRVQLTVVPGSRE